MAKQKDEEAGSAKQAKAGAPEQLMSLPVDGISVSGMNPRKSFDEKSLGELAEDLKKRGLLEPIVVRPVKGGGHELVLGERRLRAAKLAGMKDIPARVLDIKDNDVLAAMLVENIQRENLSPLEEAQAILDLLKGGMQQKQVAAVLHKSEAWVSERLDLCYTPSLIQPAIDAGIVPVRATRSLKKIEKSEQALDYLQKQIALSAAKGEKLTNAQLESMTQTALDSIEELSFNWWEIDDDVRDKITQAAKVYEKGDSSEFTDHVESEWDDWAESEFDKCRKCKSFDSKSDICLDDGCRKAKFESHVAEVLGLMLKASEDFRTLQEKEKQSDAKKASSGVPDLDSLNSRDYHVFPNASGAFPKCKNCPDKKKATHYNGRCVETACLNTNCYRKLNANMEREKRDKRLAKVEAFRSSTVKPFVKELLSSDNSLKAMLVWHLLEHSGDANGVGADVRQFSGGKIVRPNNYGSINYAEKMLQSYSLDEALEFAVERTILQLHPDGSEYSDPASWAGIKIKELRKVLSIVQQMPKGAVDKKKGIEASRSEERAQIKAKAAAIEARDKEIHKAGVKA